MCCPYRVRWALCAGCSRDAKKPVYKPVTEFYFHKGNGKPEINCKDCRKAAVKKWQDKNRDRVRQYKRKYETRVRTTPGLREERLAKQIAASKRYRDYLREHDPKKYKEYLEDSRIRSHLARELKGKKPSTKIVSVSNVNTRLDIGPIKRWVQHKLANGYHGQTTVLAHECKVEDRTIYGILREYKYTSLEIVDRMLTNEGTTNFWELYDPDTFEPVG